jgi:hypothetical protein
LCAGWAKNVYLNLRTIIKGSGRVKHWFFKYPTCTKPHYVASNFKMTSLLILAASTLLFLLVRHFLKDTTNATHSMSIKSDNVTDTFIELTPTEFAKKYKSQQGQVKGGTLCFWGHWFGKPYDNFHQITSVDFDTTTNVLTIRFSEQETLTVTFPSGITEYKDRLVIANADKVYWQWYYYGKVQEPENLFHYNITKNGDTITGSTNANWYKAN